MFENLYVDALQSKASNKFVRSDQLVRRFVERQTVESLSRGGELTAAQKRALRQRRVRRRVRQHLEARYARRARPEETFEVWHPAAERQDSGVAAVIDAAASPSDRGDAGSDGDSDDSDRGEADLSEGDPRFARSGWTRASVLIRTRGLETLPQKSVEPDSATYQRNAVGFTRYHVANLRDLLHINMLRRNWSLAYKVLCLLVRLPNVDLRSLWPLAVEVLARRQAQRGAPGVFKDERFLDWLASMYPLGRTAAHARRIVAAPAWRGGSRTHAPVYVATQLWRLLARRQVARVAERVEELLLEPPYATDGTFHFLLAVCRVCQCHDVGLSAAEVDAHARAAVSSLRQCRRYRFEYPRDVMHHELRQVSSVEPQDESSDDEAPPVPVTYPDSDGYLSEEMELGLDS
ncbi:RNA polymerase I-specific transcription initiation factor RRN11 [[Candida] zeylanoides]